MRQKHNKKKWWLLIVNVCVLFFWITTVDNSLAQSLYGEEEIVSGKKLPQWAREISPNYFVGISLPYTHEADARSAALLDARKQILDRLGVMLSKIQLEKILDRNSKADPNIVETDTEGDIQTIAISKGLIAVKAEKYHVQKYKRRQNNSVSYYHIAYVKVPFSKPAHDAMIGRIFEEIEKSCHSRMARINSDVFADIQPILEDILQLENTCEQTRQMIGLRPEYTIKMDQWKADLAIRKAAILADVTIWPLGKNQSVGDDNYLSEPVGIEMAYHNSPVRGIQVDVIEQSQVIGSGITDVQGRFIYSYQKPILGEIKLSLQPKFGAANSLPAIEFTFKNQVKVVVNIPELPISPEISQKFVENSVIQCLLQNQMLVDQGCELSQELLISFLKGSLSDIPDSSCIDGKLVLVGRSYAYNAGPLPLNPGLFIAKASAELKLIDTRNQILVWNTKIVADGQLRESPQAAGNSALQMLARQVADEVRQKFALIRDDETIR